MSRMREFEVEFEVRRIGDAEHEYSARISTIIESVPGFAVA